ncbi:MAG: NAD(P)H-hydrate dehydratase [Bdellovibrionales bacterium]|nr:NAD(P)H-hydrate dehydratase [Bdellovibrionales bacterium]
MRLATVDQSKKIDENSQKNYGLSGEILMECAGALAAREVDQSYFPELSRGEVGVVCGPGNNGGDGFVLARHLHSAGHRDLTIYIVGSKEQRSPLCQLQIQRIEQHGLRAIFLEDTPEKLERLRSSKLVIDALFGIGLNRPIEAPFVKVVDLINSLKVPVVSLDTPSGLDCDRGAATGAVVQADMTITFGLAKPGFFVGEGPYHVGKLRILPIGFPLENLRNIATTHFLFNEKLARRYLPTRKESSNKSDHGRLAVVAGRAGMWGAGLLASSSAYRMGSGYVHWLSFEPHLSEVMAQPEILTGQLQTLSQLNEVDYSAFAVGPGLGVSQKTADLIEFLKADKDRAVVVDADAITTCVQFDLFPLPAQWVITPHAGELSRVLKVSSQEIEMDRYHSVLQAAEKTGCHVLLKGYRSVVGYQNRCMVIHSGNAALAKAGSGDVLTGMIGSLLGQGLDTLQATAAAAYIHGRMADEWVRSGKDKSSLMPTDIADSLPGLLGRISGGAIL